MYAIELSSFQQLDGSIEDSFASIDRFELQLADELRRMRNEKLYVDGGYESFEKYCEIKLSKWGGYRRVNQLLGFSQVTDILKGTKFDGVVKRESHARQVLRLVKTPEKLLETVAIASQSNPNPTAKDFRAAAQKVVPFPKKSQEQLFLTGAEAKVSSIGHPREGQTGMVSGDPPNHTHLFIVFPNSEQSELIAIDDLDVKSVPYTPRQYPKQYEEAIAQLKLQHQEELRRLEDDIRAGLLAQAEERAIASVREQLEVSQAIASHKTKEVVKLSQRIEELESLRTLEIENQQLLSRIQELERALEKRPEEECGNTSTKQAAKTINANTIKIIESLEPDLHLRSLATSPPTDAAEAMRLMSLAMGNLAKALNDTQAISAAAILLKCNPTPEAIAYQMEMNQMVYQTVGDIRKELQRGCDWNGFWAIASEYEAIKKAYWRELTQDEKNLITLLKQEFDEEERGKREEGRREEIHPPSFPDNPWLLTPQSWQSGGKSCKYVRMNELSLLFNDEKWLAITPSDQEKYINPRLWLDRWEEKKTVEGVIAHTDINKQAYTYHGAILGVNPDLQKVHIQWAEIPDARWYGTGELRVKEAKKS